MEFRADCGCSWLYNLSNSTRHKLFSTFRRSSLPQWNLETGNNQFSSCSPVSNSATALFGSFMLFLLILVQTAPPSAAAIPKLGKASTHLVDGGGGAHSEGGGDFPRCIPRRTLVVDAGSWLSMSIIPNCRKHCSSAKPHQFKRTTWSAFQIMFHSKSHQLGISSC